MSRVYDISSNTSKTFRKKKSPVGLVIGLILLIVAVAVVAWFIVSSMNRNQTNEVNIRVYSVITQEITEQNISDYFKINGDVIATNLVNVFPDVQMGKLSSYTVKVGQYVNRNQIIGYIDPSQPGMDFSLNPIRSPIAGTIASLPVDVGARVVSSTVLAQVGNLSSLQIEGFVPERLLGRLNIGAPVEIIIPSYPNLEITGKVSEIAPAIDINSRTVMIRVMIDEVPPQMRSGMFVQLNIESQSYDDVLVVSQNALITRGGKPYLFVVSNSEQEAKSRGYTPATTANHNAAASNPQRSLISGNNNQQAIIKYSADVSGWATLTPVELGFGIDGRVIVTSGVESGDRVIVSGQTELNNASPVTIVDTVQ